MQDHINTPAQKKPPLSGTVESGGRYAFYVGTGIEVGKGRLPLQVKTGSVGREQIISLGQKIWMYRTKREGRQLEKVRQSESTKQHHHQANDTHRIRDNRV